MIHVDAEELEALALGRLPAGRAAEVEAHAASCAECGRELAWARAERALFERRARTQAEPALWAAIESRIAPGAQVLPLRPPRRRVFAVAAAGLAAAAAILISVVPARRAPVEPVGADELDAPVEPEVLAALDGAERDYRKALAKMEDKSAAQRLEKARAGIPPGDVHARLRVLNGYAAVLRSLQRAADLEEADR